MNIETLINEQQSALTRISRIHANRFNLDQKDVHQELMIKLLHLSDRIQLTHGVSSFLAFAYTTCGRICQNLLRHHSWYGHRNVTVDIQTAFGVSDWSHERQIDRLHLAFVYRLIRKRWPKKPIYSHIMQDVAHGATTDEIMEAYGLPRGSVTRTIHYVRQHLNRKSKPVGFKRLRKCTGCGEEKPLTPEYWHRKDQSKGGLNSKCKVCVIEINNRYRLKAVWQTAH